MKQRFKWLALLFAACAVCLLGAVGCYNNPEPGDENEVEAPADHDDDGNED